MTVDLCLLHSAWPGARPSPPRPNASTRASWRCLACDGGMFTFGDGEYREVPSYDEQNWGDCVGEPAKLPSGGCRICVNPWQLLFFFLVVERHRPVIYVGKRYSKKAEFIGWAKSDGGPALS